MARRRNQKRAVGQGIRDLKPRVIKRGVTRVVARPARAPVEDLARGQPRRAVEDRHAIARVLAMGDQLALQRGELRLVAVARKRHRVGHADHRDLVDRSEADQAAALLDVAAELPQRRAADPHHPAAGATVLEEAAHGVGEEGALHEGPVVRLVQIPADLRELPPTRNPERGVDRSARARPTNAATDVPTPSIGLEADGTSSTYTPGDRYVGMPLGKGSARQSHPIRPTRPGAPSLNATASARSHAAATPVWVTIPPVVASPNAWVSRSSSPQSAPAWTRAVRAFGSTRIPFIEPRSMTMPPSQTDRPG